MTKEQPPTGSSFLEPVGKDLSLDLKRAFKTFIICYQEKYGHKPLITRGKDHRLMKQILDVLGQEKTEEFIRMFIEDDSDFIRIAGRTISVFKSQLPKYIEEKREKTKTKDLKRCLCGKPGTIRVGNQRYCHKCSETAI